MKLYTIGYQGAAPEALVAALQARDVAWLVDVRAVAWSRRPAFGGKALARALAAGGIGYRHVKALGNPARGVAGFEPVYRAHLATPAAEAALHAVAALAAAEPCCLLCLERDPATCHRTIAAEAIASLAGLEIEPLFAVPQVPRLL